MQPDKFCPEFKNLIGSDCKIQFLETIACLLGFRYNEILNRLKFRRTLLLVDNEATQTSLCKGK